jgi:diadenosine tetraphosphate (Ap4A) HIT family hydrolase
MLSTPAIHFSSTPPSTKKTTFLSKVLTGQSVEKPLFQDRHMAVVMNIDPSRPGHALVCSHRPVQYLSELTPDELTSMGLLTQAYQRFWNNHPSNVGKQFEYVVFINDGPHSGQSVPHFHMQIVPVNKKQPISKGMVRHAIALKPMNEKGKPVSADFVKNNADSSNKCPRVGG